MAGLDDFFADRMIYNEDKFPEAVRQDDDGCYRWRCKLDAYHDRKMYALLFKIMAVIALGGAVFGFFLARAPLSLLREDPALYQRTLWGSRALYALLGYAAFMLAGVLIIGLVRLIDGGPAVYWYQMNDEFVRIKPSGRGSGVHAFSNVKRVWLYPSVNEIRLISRWGKCPVLVRKEDFERVKAHILAHMPADVDIVEKDAQ